MAWVLNIEFYLVLICICKTNLSFTTNSTRERNYLERYSYSKFHSPYHRQQKKIIIIISKNWKIIQYFNIISNNNWLNWLNWKLNWKNQQMFYKSNKIKYNLNEFKINSLYWTQWWMRFHTELSFCSHGIWTIQKTFYMIYFVEAKLATLDLT